MAQNLREEGGQKGSLEKEIEGLIHFKCEARKWVVGQIGVLSDRGTMFLNQKYCS